MRSAWSIFVHVTLCLCAGIVPQKDYVLAERLVVNDSVHVTLCLCAGIVPQKDYVLAERLVVNDSVHVTLLSLIHI